MNWLKISFLSIFMLASSAYAKDSAHILSAASASTLNAYKSTSWSDDYDLSFGLATGYDYAFTGGLQLGGDLEIGVFSGGSIWLLDFGPGYNFNTDVENSFFTSFKGGVVYSQASDSTTDDTDAFLTLQIGKRCKMMENVSFVPSIKVTQFLGSNSPDPSFQLDLFRFAIVF